MALLSVVVPCYNEEKALPFFYEKITQISEMLKERYQLETEYWFVDDGSRDRTLELVKELRATDSRVHYVSFSRNFGKEAGIYAGLEAARGEYVTLMDADLQDPPELLPEMFRAVTEEKYDCAATRRVDRKGEPPVRSFFARCFYRLINRISKTEIVDGARDFRLMTRQMVDAILSMSEVNRFSKGIFGWVGFRTKWIEFENVERVAGETKWSFWKLFLYSIDGIVAFSTAPLAIASVAGLFFCGLAFLALLFIFVRALAWGDPVAGWPSMVCIILLVGGIQLFSIGVLGQYLSKTYLETKRRPVYIAREKE
ncbi:glycosyltransferase family 2 protein [Anaerofilum sp. BX8]|uniref:Glycosyltransferase family 2 protein n=1 Tax=Anaerofilum hominis TaxID=2763016 RepID=A0A923L0E5_9FIRM|nr:glycosyltransferase family 2 protein [Anaerofilum hominis]MBC5580325.1 glycosyltransferase family 2 protein [Anaerofilum hominis]